MSLAISLQISNAVISHTSSLLTYAPVQYAPYDPYLKQSDTPINGTLPSKTVIPVDYSLLTNKVNPAATGNVSDGSLAKATDSAAQPGFYQLDKGSTGTWYHSTNAPDAGVNYSYGPEGTEQQAIITGPALVPGSNVNTSA